MQISVLASGGTGHKKYHPDQYVWDERGYVHNEEDISEITCSDPLAAERISLSFSW